MLSSNRLINQKIIFAIFILLLSCTSTFAQWKWQHPSPQGNDLNVISFANATTGWIGGAGGAILKTTNGGSSWTSQNCNFFNQVAGIYFPNTADGYIAMEYNFLKTTNGGSTWSVNYRFSNLYAQSMYFLNADTGWIAGVFNGIYSIQQTLDGGNTWSSQINNLNDEIKAIQVNTSGNGWAVGTNGLYMQTTNFGTSWTTSTPAGASILNALSFTDDLNGYMVANGGSIYKTIDGGTTWSPSTNPSAGADLESVSFSDPNTGIVSGTNGILLSTINGGTSWQSNNQPTWFTGNAAATFNGGNFLVVGSFGEILKSTNIGTTWVSSQVRVADKNLSGVCSSTSNLLFATGDAGTILTSTFGSNWQALNSGITSKLNDIAALTSTNITAVGDGGTILNSTNGGTSWTSLTSPVIDDLYSICRASATRLFACGNGESIIRSNNSGATWLPQTTTLSGAGFKFLDVFFVSADTGWIATDGFEILRTVNGGTNWSITSTTFTPGISSVFFINKLHGWACTINGDVLESIDGGVSYQLLYSKNGSSFDKIVFTDAQNGWLFGNGKVYRTADGGINWSNEYIPTSQHIKDAVFLNGSDAVAVGDGLATIIARTGDLRLLISDTLLCTDNTYTTTVNSTGTFNPGNIFDVQISDEFGNFDYPISVGSANATSNTPILISVPAGLIDASTYRLRVLSTNPPINSPVNSSALTLHNSPNAFAFAGGPTAFCNGDSVTIYAIYSSAWTYQWFKNSILINGATSDSITVSQTGDYTVNANDGICDYTSSIVDVLVVTCTGIAEVSGDKNYHAYPNPTSGKITFEWNRNVVVNQISLKDVAGRTIKTINNISGQKQEIDLSTLQSGIYFITTSGNKPSTIKVVRY